MQNQQYWFCLSSFSMGKDLVQLPYLTDENKGCAANFIPSVKLELELNALYLKHYDAE